MFFLTVLLFVVPFVSALSGVLVDYRLTLTTTTATKNCSSPGLFCESCSSLVTCIEDASTETWTKTHVKTCTTPDKCLNQLNANDQLVGSCTTDPDYICDNVVDLAFPCTSQGIFPDPFYCNKFVMCATVSGKLNAFSGTCDQGWGYDVKTDLCDVELAQGLCPLDEYPVDVCNNAGESEVMKDKSSMYYICQEYGTKNVLYPYLYLCPHGQIFESNVCGHSKTITAS